MLDTTKETTSAPSQWELFVKGMARNLELLKIWINQNPSKVKAFLLGSAGLSLILGLGIPPHLKISVLQNEWKLLNLKLKDLENKLDTLKSQIEYNNEFYNRSLDQLLKKISYIQNDRIPRLQANINKNERSNRDRSKKNYAKLERRLIKLEDKLQMWTGFLNRFYQPLEG